MIRRRRVDDLVRKVSAADPRPTADSDNRTDQDRSPGRSDEIGG